MPLPDMSDALWGLEVPIMFQIISKRLEDYELVEGKQQPKYFYGVMVPGVQSLKLKPEGQRNWRWWTLHTKQVLQNDDLIKDQMNVMHRVMSRQAYASVGAGYYEYEVKEEPV